jgi:hypothetical protein
MSLPRGNGEHSKYPRKPYRKGIVGTGDFEYLKLSRELLKGLPDFKDEDHIPTMALAVAKDFFTLLTRTAEKLNPDLEASSQ